MSAPRSVLALASESLVWVKANHQPSTNPHMCFGNKTYEAEGREVSGRNASEGIEHRNYQHIGKVDTVHEVVDSIFIIDRVRL